MTNRAYMDDTSWMTMNSGESIMSLYKYLGKLVVNKEMRDLGNALVNSNVSGAEVVGRGTIVVDGKVIASSDEFQKLKDSAMKIVRARTEQNQATPV